MTNDGRYIPILEIRLKFRDSHTSQVNWISNLSLDALFAFMDEPSVLTCILSKEDSPIPGSIGIFLFSSYSPMFVTYFSDLLILPHDLDTTKAKEDRDPALRMRRNKAKVTFIVFWSAEFLNKKN
jgi:hypothetical protein